MLLSNDHEPDWIWKEGNLSACLQQIGMAPDSAASLCRALAKIAPDPTRREAIHKAHEYIFLEDSAASDLIDFRATIQTWEPETAPLAEVFALLLEYPQTLRRNRFRGIPDAVTHETLRDLDRWMQNFQRRQGYAGFDRTSWMHKHFRGALFSLGRLQFELGRACLPYRIYRHRGTGQIVALAEEGLECSDAELPVTGGGSWKTSLRESASAYFGHAVNPSTGTIRPDPESLPRTDWEFCLQPGAPVLHVHIPEGERLDEKPCDLSIRRAWEFFPQHFPETLFTAMMCRTWLLDPQLTSLGVSPPDSNIARFAARFHPLPCPDATDAQFFERIFSRPVGRSQPLPRDNSLRRAIAPLLEKGPLLRVTGGVCLRENGKLSPRRTNQ